jgi:hypothetical protein
MILKLPENMASNDKKLISDATEIDIYDTSEIRALQTRGKFAKRGEAELCNRTSLLMMRYHRCILCNIFSTTAQNYKK